MSRSEQELNKKLTAAEMRLNSYHEQVANLEYQIKEMIGCFDELEDMPCKSLINRMRGACKRAELVVKKYQIPDPVTKVSSEWFRHVRDLKRIISALGIRPTSEVESHILHLSEVANEIHSEAFEYACEEENQ